MEKAAPEDKCEEVIPFKRLPMELKQKPNLEEPRTLELKHLLDHREYVFLGKNETFEVIYAKSLMGVKNGRLMEVLGCHKLTFDWTIANIQEINPPIVTFHIYTDEAKKPVRHPQRHFMVVKKEVIKLLDNGLIYLISDFRWVSPIQCVPKNRGMIVVQNKDKELIAIGPITR